MISTSACLDAVVTRTQSLTFQYSIMQFPIVIPKSQQYQMRTNLIIKPRRRVLRACTLNAHLHPLIRNSFQSLITT